MNLETRAGVIFDDREEVKESERAKVYASERAAFIKCRGFFRALATRGAICRLMCETAARINQDFRCVNIYSYARLALSMSCFVEAAELTLDTHRGCSREGIMRRPRNRVVSFYLFLRLVVPARVRVLYASLRVINSLSRYGSAHAIANHHHHRRRLTPQRHCNSDTYMYAWYLYETGAIYKHRLPKITSRWKWTCERLQSGHIYTRFLYGGWGRELYMRARV